MNPKITADQALVRQINTVTVMDTLRLFAPLSRADLSSRTGLNRSTISSIVADLIGRNFVRETTLQDPSIGRPGMSLEFNPMGGCAIGLEIGVDFLSVLLVNFTAEVLWRERIEQIRVLPQAELVEKAAQMVEACLEHAAQVGLRPLGIGVGVPGLVDASQSSLVLAPNLKWQNVPLHEILSKRFNLPVFVENEANSAALGEYFYGAAHGKSDFIYLSTGVGLGGGIMLGGKLFKGSGGYAGEIGHITIYENGELCGCGRRGCWETYIGPQAILRRVRQLLENSQSPSILYELANGQLETLDMKAIVLAAKRADPVTISGLSEVGQHLGAGLANLINIFNPELVVLGGALSLVYPWLKNSVQHAINASALSPLVKTVTVRPSQLGLDSCVYGAVAMVLDGVLRNPLADY
jgi:glucokinase-like ROK family protein